MEARPKCPKKKHFQKNLKMEKIPTTTKKYKILGACIKI